FVRYVNTARVLHIMHYPSRFPNHLVLADSGSWCPGMRRRARQMSRREVYSCLEELNSDKSHAVLSFANIFNRQSCWKKGVFSNPNRRYRPATVYSQKEV